LTNILVLSKLEFVLDSALLAAVASPRRLEILRLIWRDERAAGEIHRAMRDVTFGAVSLQLRTLVDAGLAGVRSEGRQRFYHARREALGDLGQTLERMWNDALWRLKLQAELEASRRGPRPRRRSTALRGATKDRSRAPTQRRKRR
jgi:DNA-binding transcriptional ArsR family regulator